MLKFLTVVGVFLLLFVILSYLIKIYNFLKMPKTQSPTLTDEELEQVLNAQEKAFFTKYANITATDPNGNALRTVTMTQSIMQAITIQQISDPNPDLVERNPLPQGNVTINEEQPWQLQQADKKEEKQKGMKSTNFTTGYEGGDCPSAVIDFDQLVAGDAAYTSLVTSILAPEQLGLVCVCPSGDGYCNWSSEMFEQFIIDTDVWNLVSVEIFDIVTGSLLSTSSMSSVISSPKNHILVQMSNPTVLQSLSSGQEIVVLFKWLDNATSTQKCMELFNRMP